MRRLFKFAVLIFGFCFMTLIFSLAIGVGVTTVYATPANENYESLPLNDGYPSPQTFGTWTYSVLDAAGQNDAINGTISTDNNYMVGNTSKVLSLNGVYGTDYAGKVKSNSGAFKLNSFKAANINSDTDNYKVVGYLLGTVVSGATQSFSYSWYTPGTVTFSGTAWQNIDEFRIVKPDGTAHMADIGIVMDDINVSAAVLPNSIISPTTANFDKYASATNYVNVPVTVTFNGNTLSSIKNGTNILVAGTDYVVSGNTVTINKTYLSAQAVGTTTLTFKFSGGSDQTLAVTVADSTPLNSTITPATANFDKYVSATNYVDVPVTMTLSGNTLSNIKSGTNTLVGGTDYVVSGTTVTIKKIYLTTQAIGTTTLTFKFSGGSDQTLAVTVADSTPLNSTITPTTASFDKYASSINYVDVPVTVTLNGNTLSSIKNGANILVAGTDYVVSGSIVTIKKTYVSAQAVGSTTLTFKFSGGSDQTLAVTVADSTPITPVPTATIANAANNTVNLNHATVAVGGTITITVTGDRQGQSGVVIGDERYIPTTWTSTESGKTGSFSLNGGSYTSLYITETAGVYTVIANYKKQNWNGTTWVENNPTITDSKTASVTVNAVTSTTYTLTYVAGTNGTTTGATIQIVNSGANGTEVIAVPNVGYHFVKWSDDVTTAARTDRNVSSNISVTSNFAIDTATPITYTLVYIAGANGTTTGAGIQVVNTGANGTAVTAIPNPGYYFVSWSDGVTTATRIDKNITANKSVTATFDKTSSSGGGSSDSTLSDIKVAGTTVTGFNAAILTYNVELAAGTTTAPAIAVTTTTSSAIAVVTPAKNLPGIATILVTSQDGTVRTYTINITVATSPVTTDFTVNSTFNMDTLQADKVLDVQTIVKNNKSLRPSVLVIVALYDGSETMVNMSYISKDIAIGNTDKLNAGFELPSNITNYKVRVFVWDGESIEESKMQPLSNVVTK